MRTVIFAAALLCLFSGAASAHARHHHYHHHYAHHHIIRAHNVAEGLGHGLIHMLNSMKTVPTAAGIDITVSPSLAARFQALIADFVAAGYTPHHIGCFARSGHVAHSRHYAGAACDFDQTGWGKTAHFMYTERAHEIIVAHGFRDGREFRDQGHVDDGFALADGYRHRHYGSHRYRHYAKG